MKKIETFVLLALVGVVGLHFWTNQKAGVSRAALVQWIETWGDNETTKARFTDMVANKISNAEANTLYFHLKNRGADSMDFKQYFAFISYKYGMNENQLQQ